MDTEWRIIPGFELYEASSDGDIRRAIGGPGTRKGKLLKAAPDKDGYRNYSLCRYNRATTVKGHKAVALAFLGPRPFPKAEIAHLDGNRWNNAPSNLRWCSRKENASHAVGHGTDPRGERNPYSKLTEDEVRGIRKAYASGLTQREVADKYRISRSHVSNITRGYMWRHV